MRKEKYDPVSHDHRYKISDKMLANCIYQYKQKDNTS